MVTRNYRAVVEYDGTQYAGFQIQANRPTIQGELERALHCVTQEFVRVNGAGRTDAGVHARGQVINFRTAWPHGDQALRRALNAVLPRDIAVHHIAVADEDFHARFSATSRVYVYTIYNAPTRAPLLERFAYHCAQIIDLQAMREATAYLHGEHDFAAFGQPPFGEGTVRSVCRAAWCVSPAEGQGGLRPRLLQFEIEANAFLRGMVRRVVGTLLDVGTGRLKVQDVAHILASREIKNSSPPVPACGLCLWHVRYGSEDERADREKETELLIWPCWIWR